MSLTDTHCHLTDEAFDEDRPSCLQRASEAGVERILLMGSDPSSNEQVVRLARTDARFRAAVGFHPEAAKDVGEADFARLTELAGDPCVVAIGEVGLDYYWETQSKKVQQEVFSRCLQLAAALGLPVAVHSRSAFSDALAMMREATGVRGVLHAFTGTAQEAADAVRAGFYLGVGGIVTFKKSEALRWAIEAVTPADVLLETDAPYLAPHPLRGRRNEPAFVRHTAEVVAKCFGIGVEEIGRLTTDNALKLFGPWPAHETPH